MLFEIQRACPRPGQSRVIASGPSTLKTLDRLTTLLPNAKVSVETLTIPTEIESDEDDDDITLAELKEQLEDNMTLADIQRQLDKVEATKKRLETIRLKKENYKNYENYEEKKEEGPFEFVDEMTYHSRTSDHLPNF